MSQPLTLINASGPQGPLMLIGDYPTLEEYDIGQSFSGSVGRLVSKLLSPYKLNTQRVYCTHYYKVPLPGYDSRTVKLRRAALDKVKHLTNFDKLLTEEIQAINPNSILAFGELALNFLTGEKGVGKFRGSILPLREQIIPKNTIKVVPTLSPRKIWAENEKPIPYVQLDVKKAISMQTWPGRFKAPGMCWIVKSATELHNWWERARSEAKFLTFDIETFHNFITCISFCHNGVEAISVPFLVGPRMDYQERAYIYKLVMEILTSQIPKVNQNIKYDWIMLESWGFRVNNIIGDTMLLQGVLYPEFPKGLDFLTSVYTEHEYYKDEGKDYDPRLHSPDRLLLYNAKDALVTHQVWTAQLEEAKDLKVKDFYFENVHPAFFIYKRMDQRGIRIDDLQRQKLLNKYKPIIKENQKFLNVLYGESINCLSPKQCGDFIYKYLKCPKSTHKTESGEVVYNTDEETIEELYINKVADEARKDALRRILLIRKISKIIQFLENPISPDGRMRTSYKLAGTETGRTSAGKALEYTYEINWTKGRIEKVNCGGSFQTIPKHGFEFGEERYGTDLRSIFVPSPGYSFVEGDQSQAEARIVAVLSDDFETLELFNTTDIHKVTATWVLGKPFESITKVERQEYGKKPRHAGNYNMGASRLSQMTHKPISECLVILERFHAASPKIRGIFHMTVRQLINNTRHLITPHGRRRDFFGRVGEDMFKEGYATIPQATVSDHNKFTILRDLAEQYPEPLAYPLNEAHDSLLFEVKTELATQFANDFKSAIETPIDFRKGSIPRDINLVIPGEIAIGDASWQEMVDWKG